MNFDPSKTKTIIFIDSNNQTRLVNIEVIEKEKNMPIDIYHLMGTLPVFEEGHPSMCSSADVNMEVRFFPKCGKGCCDL